MSAALDSLAFLLLSLALGFSLLGALHLTTVVERLWASSDGQTDVIDEAPSDLQRMFKWIVAVLGGAGLLNYFPGLHPGLATQPWAAYAWLTAFGMMALGALARKTAGSMDADGKVDWPLLGLGVVLLIAEFGFGFRDLLP